MNIPVGYAQVRYYFTSAVVSREAMTQVGVKLTGGGYAPTIATDALTALAPVWNTVGSSSASLVRCEVQVGPNPTAPTIIATTTDAGAIGGAAISPQVAVLVSKLSAAGGRPNRGRFYFPFTGEDLVDGAGRLPGANVVTINAALATYRTAMATAMGDLCILHTDAATPTVITSLICTGVVGTQRKRLVR